MVGTTEILRVARLYYVYGLNQEDIAKKLGISRSSVSRILQEARNRGLVQVKIETQIKTDFHLAERLKSLYGLTDAVVVYTQDHNNSLEGEIDYDYKIKVDLAEAAAKYFETVVTPNLTIGVSWGTTLYEFAKRARFHERLSNLTFVQLLGGFGLIAPDIQATEIVRLLSENAGGKSVYLPAPGLAASLHARNLLLKDPIIGGVLDLARRSEIAVISIGEISESSTLVRTGQIKTDELKKLKEGGAVGDICLQFFNSEGKPCCYEISSRAIGLTLEEIKTIPTVIAISGGRKKTAALRGALKGGLVHVLITDDMTAQSLVKEEGEEQVNI